MPDTWIPNSGSQLERALRQHFINEGAIPNSKVVNSGIYVTLDHQPRQNPMRTILAHDASEEVDNIENDVWDVMVVDQFDAIAQPGEKNPVLRRRAIDEQIGKMMRAMSLTENNYDYGLTAKYITDAGRSLVATEGQNLAAGNWPFISETHLRSRKVVTVVIGRQYLYVAGNSTGLFTSNETVDGSGPEGAGDEIAAGYFTATQTQYNLYGPNDTSEITASIKVVAQDNEDMAEFTCLTVRHVGKSRGHPKDEEMGINENTWREARMFRITCAPSKIEGYSNTSGQ